MAFQSPHSIMNSTSVFKNISFHLILILIESLLTSQYIIYSLVVLSDKTKEPFIVSFISMTFHNIYYQHCLTKTYGFISIIIVCFFILFDIITQFIRSIIYKCQSNHHIIILIYDILFYRYFSLLVIDSLTFFLVNKTIIQYNKGIIITIGLILLLYLFRAICHLSTFASYISISRQHISSIRDNNISYPFDIFFSKIYDIITICGKILISIGLNYNKNKVKSEFLANLILIAYLAMIASLYLYYVVYIAYLGMYHFFAINSKLNIIRFFFLQMNICVMICFLWLYTSEFYFTLFIFSIFASAGISCGMTYYFIHTYFNRALKYDLFSLHQMLFLLGNERLNSDEISRILTDIIVYHMCKCKKLNNAQDCAVCAMNNDQMTIDDYLSLYYTIFLSKKRDKRFFGHYHKFNQSSFLSFELIKLFVLFKKDKIYAFYLKYNTLVFQYRQNKPFIINLTSLFNNLIEQGTSDKYKRLFYKTLFKIKKLNDDLDSFLLDFSTLINRDDIFNTVYDFIDLGSSIIKIKEKIKDLEGFQTEMHSCSSEGKIYQDIFDICYYIFNITYFGASKIINDQDSYLNHYDININEDFMDSFYKNNKTLLLQMVENPFHFQSYSISIVYNKKRLHKDVTEINFYKIFPKQFQKYCEKKFINCFSNSMNLFHFFLQDLSDYLIDFQYKFNLIPFEKDLLIKGEVYYNTKNLLLFMKKNQDEDFVLQSFSQRVSQILKIEPYLIEYTKYINHQFFFNELFLPCDIKNDTYYVNSLDYHSKLKEVTTSFLENKDNVEYSILLKQNCQTLLIQKDVEIILLESDIINEGDFTSDNYYKMFILEEKLMKQNVKHIENDSKITSENETQLYIKMKEMGSSSTINSSVSADRISTLKRKNAHKQTALKYKSNFFILTVMVVCLDIVIVIITIISITVQAQINNKLKLYHTINIQEKRVECYLAHMTIEILMSPCVYNEQADTIYDRLNEYSKYTGINLRIYIFEELKEKNLIFSQLLSDYHSNIYSSTDEKIRKLSKSKIEYIYVSQQLKGNQLITHKEQVLFTEGLKLFANSVIEIVTYQNIISCDKRAISIIYSDKDDPYFVNLHDVLLSTYQKSIYEIILNYSAYYDIFAEMKALLYSQTNALYQDNLIDFIIFSILLFCSKLIVVSVCFVSISVAKKLLILNLTEIYDKLTDKVNLEYYNGQITNIRSLCQLNGDNPLKMIFISAKLKRLFKKNSSKSKINLHSHQSTNESSSTHHPLITNPNNHIVKESFLEELFTPSRAFLFSLIGLATLVSIVIPFILYIFLVQMQIVIGYSHINSAIEINMFLVAVLTEIALLSNQANLPLNKLENISMLYKEDISELNQVLLSEIVKKEQFQSNYKFVLKSLDSVMVTDSCQSTFENIDDIIVINLKTKGIKEHSTFYPKLCALFNYDYVDYPFSFYDIQYRLKKLVEHSFVTGYENIFPIFNDMQSMNLFSILLFISRPIVNFFNSKALQDKLIQVANNYVTILSIGLIGDCLIDFIVFYFMEKMVTGKFQKITRNVIILNQSLKIESD